MWPWVLLYIGLGLLGLVALLAVIGSFLSKSHEVSLSLDCPLAPAALWDIIADIPGQTRWRKQLKEVTFISDAGGKPIWREVMERGRGLPLQTILSDPPKRMVRRICDPRLPFGGEWVYEIEPTSSGSRLTVTEHGEIYQPVFRLLSKCFDLSATLRAYLRDLEECLKQGPFS